MSRKIYWYCFKRQLEELYDLLYSEKFISCEASEFISHFTGKKFRVDEEYTGKIKWNGEEEFLQVVVNHLMGKKFIDDLSIYDHFVCVTDTNQHNNTPNTEQLKGKLEALFPAETGYRCRQRLFYRDRNGMPPKKMRVKIIRKNV